VTLLEQHLRDRRTVRLPLDSLAVIARAEGGLRSRVVAQTLAEDVSGMLTRSRHLRVPRFEFVEPYATTELTVEEIGRALNVRGVALLTVTAEALRVNVAVDLVDVLREELITHEQLLVSDRELLALEREVIRILAAECAIPEVPSRHPVTDDEALYARFVEARLARTAGAFSEALAILDTVQMPAGAIEFAATVFEGRIETRQMEARARLAETRSAMSLVWEAKLRFRFERDWRGAEELLRYAIAIDAALPAAHAMLGDLLLAGGRDEEAAVHHRVVSELMP
jgi:TolB-like protein